MSKHKYTNLICMIVIAFAVILTVLIIVIKSGHETGTEKSTMEYETKLFDTDIVHTIDIVIDQTDWDNLQQNASDEEYVKCDVVIDGEKFSNVAIRAKGNSSLSSVTQQGSERYSFKIEFDHYKDGATCWGLDKLSLNNTIQDTTYMKDYLCYTLMRKMGVDAPLCSYNDVSVNGEDFGLYLAAEGVEESFVERTYGQLSGNLYKPDTMSGMNNLNNNDNINNFNQNDNQGVPDFSSIYQYFGNGMPDFSQMYSYFGEMPDTDFRNGAQGGKNFSQDNNNQRIGNAGGFGGASGNSSDVALKYIDDEISSYSNIFDNAVLDASDADKERLIASIKQLNSGENLEEVLNVDEILSYFVVHNFVDNYDSYTGSLLHNYYLYEKDGVLSMIAWDYNLAFGGFSMGQGMGNNAQESTDSATTYVNFPIDTPVSGATLEDRPLLNVLLSDNEYLEQYHELFDEFISTCFEDGYCNELIDSISELIEPYVEKDKTAFYSLDEFKTGVSTLKDFCDLRAQSIRGQLDGTIPSTSDGQEGSDTLIDASKININDLGGASDMGFNRNGQTTISNDNNSAYEKENQGNDNLQNYGQIPDRNNLPGYDQMPDMNSLPGYGHMPDMNNQIQGRDASNRIDGENTSDNSDTKDNFSVIAITGISIVFLIIGLISIKKYRRRKY